MHRVDKTSISKLPDEWQAYLHGASVIPVVTGMSAAEVFRIETASGPHEYLKVAAGQAINELKQEIERTRWLRSRGVRVPTILMELHGLDVSAFVMRAVQGEPITSIVQSDGVPTALAEALSSLHAIPVAECPYLETINVRLSRAKRQVEQGLIDESHFAIRNASVSAADLLSRLSAHLPAYEDLVVVHGDAGLNNILIGDDGKIGFIDCGHAGRADRYTDLALVVEGLQDQFGAAASDGFVKAYGLADWDEDKAAFYRDLYELF